MNNFTGNEIICMIAEMNHEMQNKYVNVFYEKDEEAFEINYVDGNVIIANDLEDVIKYNLNYSRLLQELIEESTLDQIIQIKLQSTGQRFVIKDILYAVDHHIYQDGDIYLLVE